MRAGSLHFGDQLPTKRSSRRARPAAHPSAFRPPPRPQDRGGSRNCQEQVAASWQAAAGLAQLRRRPGLGDAARRPAAPRSRERSIPADLETIILKALSKEPGSRYATAADLAADPRRWLGHEPIRARRPGLVERARKWSRWHPTLVGSLAAGLLVGVAVLGLGKV